MDAECRGQARAVPASPELCFDDQYALTQLAEWGFWVLAGGAVPAESPWEL